MRIDGIFLVLCALLLLTQLAAALDGDDDGDVVEVDEDDDVGDSPFSSDLPSAAETCIVGAGPAGLQLAYFLSRAGRDYVVLEKASAPGAFFTRYPRHGKLISINKLATGGDSDLEFAMRHDWNSLLVDHDDPRGVLRFSTFSEAFYPPREAMHDYLAAYAERYDLNVRYRVSVTRVRRTRDRLQGGKGRARFSLDLVEHHDTPPSSPPSQPLPPHVLRCGAVVVATGLSSPAYPRSAPGIHFTEGYEDFDPSTAAERYRGKRVLVLGTGNSAFEVADSLIGVANIVQLCSRNPPRFSWQTHYAGDVRSVNAGFLDTYQLKSQHYLDTCIVSAQTPVLQHPDGRLEFGVPLADNVDTDFDSVRDSFYHGRGPQRDHSANTATFDHIIRALGFRMSRAMFDDETRPEMDKAGKYPQLTPSWEAVHVPNLFFAGTLMAGRDNKRSSVFAIHGFRYAVRTLFHTLEERYHNVSWPGQNLPHDSAAVAGAIVERVQYSGGLYQMFSTMCEAFYFERNCPAELQTDATQAPITTPGCWRHETELPCDRLFTSAAYATRSFLVVTLEYHPEFGKTQERYNVFGPKRVDPTLHPAEGYKSNFLHPVVRYYTALRDNGSVNPHFKAVDPSKAKTAEDATAWQQHVAPTQAVAVHHMMESVHIDFAHAEGHIEPLVRFLEGLFHTRPELLPVDTKPPQDRVQVRRLHLSASRSPPPAAPAANFHPQAWLDNTINMRPAELRAAYRHTLSILARNGSTMTNSGSNIRPEPEWRFDRVIEGMEGAYIESGEGRGDAGANPRPGGMSKEEQLQSLGEHLHEALDRPFPGMPELDEIQSAANRAKEAQLRVEERLGNTRPSGRAPQALDLEAFRKQDHDKVAATLGANDGTKLTDKQRGDAAAFMRGASEALASLEQLQTMFGSILDKTGMQDSQTESGKRGEESRPAGPHNKPGIRIKPKAPRK